MIIPYGTDAPIYHWPIATVGMIALNVVIYGAFRGDPDAIEPWMLALGSGLHPVQWLSHNFLHEGIFHLVGNMIFLWSFGIIVEGKLGVWKFLLCYALIGIAQGAVVQVLFLGMESPSHALGASAVIFGLMAMCLIWAPKNSLSCFVLLGGFFRFHANTYEIPIVWFAVFQIGSEIWDLVFHHAVGAKLLSSALLHVTGFGLGVALGLGMLKANLVDCEGWDLLEVMAGRAGRTGSDKFSSRLTKKKKARSSAIQQKMDEAAAKTKSKGKARRDSEEGQDSRASIEAPAGVTAIDRVRAKLDSGEVDAALRIYDKTSRVVPSWPSQAELMDLIKQFHARGHVVDSIPLMRDFGRLYPQSADRVRLNLAQILIRDRERPTQALRVLNDLPKTLPPPLDAARRSLRQKAEAMIEDGVLELEAEE